MQEKFMSHENLMINIYHVWLRKNRQPFSIYDLEPVVKHWTVLKILKNNGYLDMVGVTDENNPEFMISEYGIERLREWLHKKTLF
jgi:hypothetical protein